MGCISPDRIRTGNLPTAYEADALSNRLSPAYRSSLGSYAWLLGCNSKPNYKKNTLQRWRPLMRVLLSGDHLYTYSSNFARIRFYDESMLGAHDIVLVCVGKISEKLTGIVNIRLQKTT